MKTDLPVQPASRVEGELRPPGDKSISHRALIVTAMGLGPVALEGVSAAMDVRSTLEAVRSVGLVALDSQGRLEDASTSSMSRDFQMLLESPGIRRWAQPPGPIDVGNSGTSIRTLLGPLAGSSISAHLTGDASVRHRPMRRVVDPLRRMGALIQGEDGGDRAPLFVRGGRLHGEIHQLSIPSAQVKTALLLAGLLAEGETVVKEDVRSRDHTERMLKYLRVPVGESIDGLSVRSTKIQNAPLSIPGDLSSAAFFLVAASILSGSDVTFTGVGLNPTRTGIIDILRSFGATVDVSGETEVCGEPRGTIRARPGDRRPVAVSGELVVRAIDELPLVGVLGALADGETVVTDASELRIKESDRIDTVAVGLRRFGVDIRPTPDGFVVRGPARLMGARVNSGGDHRIAMAFAVTALAAEGPSIVEDWDAVRVSYPGFERDLQQLVVR